MLFFAGAMLVACGGNSAESETEMNHEATEQMDAAAEETTTEEAAPAEEVVDAAEDMTQDADSTATEVTE